MDRQCDIAKAETLEGKVARLVREEVAIVSYDPRWPAMFEAERRNLCSCLPKSLLGRIEHFGSTAVPDLAAKPIIDMLVEVSSLEKTRRIVPAILEPQGYEYLWRPTSGDDGPPFYAWFIKRNGQGRCTLHIHMVEADFPHWQRLLFRDFLIAHPEAAFQYAGLKQHLAGRFSHDRAGYTRAKREFIRKIMDMANPQRP